MPKQLVGASTNMVQDPHDIFINILLMFAIEEPQFLLGYNAATTNRLTSDKAPLASVDPVEAYIDLLPLGEEPVVLTVAKDSQSLHSVMMLIDNKEEVECITNSGSQIISMSAKIASNLGLSYNPNIVLNMQSANVYLQIHVLQSPAYNILLRHPFDVLTQSVVNTLSNVKTTTLPISTTNANITPIYVNTPFPAQFVANEPAKQKGVQVKKKYKLVTMKTKPVTSHISKDFSNQVTHY
ncbi:hypothetical protein C0989_002763 [Termitomyces sp. Mn162]|nr:hypothetical protein C0989_002763 [Termitomyces sp. Mn162]